MVEKSETSISLKGVKLGKKEELHRCEYCHKAFMTPPIVAFLKPSKNYKPGKKYPAFQLCSAICQDRLKQEGWVAFQPQD